MWRLSGIVVLNLATTKGIRNDIICRHGSAFSFPIVKKKFMLSSGPGGQNVQKVNTKAQLFCRLDDVMGVSVELKNYILRVHKFTNDDEIVVSSDKFRSQKANLDDCFKKFDEMFVAYEKEFFSINKQPSDEDIEILDQREKRRSMRRLEEKRKLSTKKKERSLHFE